MTLHPQYGQSPTILSRICCVIVIIALIFVTGCTGSSHERYTQVTVTEKFYVSQPMPFVNPELVSNPAWYYYDYYIRYTTGENPHVDRVSKDTYAMVYENNTYVLKWGYVNDVSDIDDEYGYTEVISHVTETPGAGLKKAGELR